VSPCHLRGEGRLDQSRGARSVDSSFRPYCFPKALESGSHIHERRRRLIKATTQTLIMMCCELWPPSDGSRLPGRPADSQLKHISMSSQMAQWNRAPTMSCMQLRGVPQIQLREHVRAAEAHTAHTERLGGGALRAGRGDVSAGLSTGPQNSQIPSPTSATGTASPAESESLFDRAFTSRTSRKQCEGCISCT
jgi:hypothetical protein